jgi:predicted RNase H-like HicB family nuclease
MQVEIVLEPSDEDGYTVFVPALPGCISEGDSLEQAKRNILEAIHLYLESDQPPLTPVAMVEEISV